jgi:hypothetical protein
MKEIKNRKIIEKNTRTESWFFEKINKIDKHLARSRKKKKREREDEIAKVKNEKGILLPTIQK